MLVMDPYTKDVLVKLLGRQSVCILCFRMRTFKGLQKIQNQFNGRVIEKYYNIDGACLA